MNVSDKDAIAFEFIDRCVRMYDHVSQSCSSAVLPGTRPTVQVLIGQELQHHLFDILKEAVTYWGSSASDAGVINYFQEALRLLASIHTYGLPRIPRAHEPIEIVSYLRQIAYECFPTEKSSRYSKIKVFATEHLGHGTHVSYDPISARAAMRFMQQDQNIAALTEELLTSSRTSTTIPVISLPRIDLNSPCNWPCLLHEIAHIDTSSDEIWEKFIAIVSESHVATAIKAVENNAKNTADASLNLKNWLAECWCDAFAVISAGPSTFFAQLHSFFFSTPSYMLETRYGAKYPPAWFRVKLMLSLAEGRLDSAHEETRRQICQTMEEEKALLSRIFSSNVPFNTELNSLLAIFKEFFRAAFPREKFTPTSNVSSLNMKQLVEDLAAGLPIPSLNSVKFHGPQRAAKSSEVLLAGWFYRCGIQREKVISILRTANEQNVDTVCEQLIALICRSDEALKRSIQMSEWFNILNDAAESTQPFPARVTSIPEENEVNLESPGVLSDRDINALLSTGALRIIPLIDAGRQVRGTVIDLRLGHNFEIFPSSVPRLIDPMEGDQDEFSDSIEIDVDFAHGIAIGPGQFLLAHTLEYIKLPKNVAAQVEGRSSFARIGLQVHMTANLVEAGFDGCLTLEILNSGPSSIMLYPGMRIGQLRFYRLSNEPNFPYGRSGENKYRGRLSHNKTRQFSDWETEAIDLAKKRFGMSN